MAPETTATISEIRFWTQPAAPPTFPFSNVGLNDLQTKSISSSGDFAQTNSCDNLLAPSLTRDALVTFTPTKLGSRLGTVTILDNGLNGTQTMSLTGNGVGKWFGTSSVSGSSECSADRDDYCTVTATGLERMPLAITIRLLGPVSVPAETSKFVETVAFPVATAMVL